MSASRKPQHRAWPALLSLTVLALAVLLLSPPLPQPLAYHDFADARPSHGLPNVLNVASNALFLAVAALGLRRLLAAPSGGRAVASAYWLLFLALAATGIGSAYYHVAPDNARLFWDRLPMTQAFAAFMALTAAECLGAVAGRHLLLPLALAGLGAVLWWPLSAAIGRENVLPYFVFQGWAILAVVLLVVLSPPSPDRRRPLLWAMALYGAALVAELLDRPLFNLGQIVSGHTLKHALAALAVYQVVRMMRAETGPNSAKRGAE